jgi:hypothetical protein
MSGARSNPRAQRVSITFGDLALSRDLPVVSIDMLNAIHWLAEAFGKEGYHLECAGDIARCSRAGTVIYDLANLEFVHAHFPRGLPASLAALQHIASPLISAAT